MNEEKIKEIAYMAWKGAANSHRLYPDNKHTFSTYWEGSKNQFDQFISPSMEGEETATLEEFLEDNLEKSKVEKWTNEIFGAGWIAALLHVKENYLKKLPKITVTNPSVTPPSEVMEEKLEECKNQIAIENGYKNWEDLYNNKSALFFAGDYLNKVALLFATKIKAVEPSGAVEFLKWVAKNNWAYNVANGHWDNLGKFDWDSVSPQTEDQLYQLFKTNKE